MVSAFLSADREPDCRRGKSKNDSSQESWVDPGFSTKEKGWGIGLSLARRIVEENHGGTLQLAAADRGATFEIILL